MLEIDDRRLAICVMDHRNKFQGSWALDMWLMRHGQRKPEEVFPDLKGFDVDAHYERLRAEQDRVGK